MIDEIKSIVKKECRDEWDWEYHLMPVVRYAKLLAKKLYADEEIVEIAAWLHDIGRLRGDADDHHVTGAAHAEKILKELRYPQDRIEKVKHCILSHRASQSIRRETIEAECVASADAMAHFDIASLFYVAFVRKQMWVPEAKEWVRGKLERSWNKLMPEAKEMMKEKYEAGKRVLE